MLKILDFAKNYIECFLFKFQGLCNYEWAFFCNPDSTFYVNRTARKKKEEKKCNSG